MMQQPEQTSLDAAADQKPVSNTARAVDELRRLIFSGELVAGSDHLETELAERLGMSRTPVREATLVLEAQGLLEVRPRKGVRILSLTVRDMEDIYDILTELESLAARRAATMGYSPDQLAALQGAINAMDAALATGNREDWAAADDAFHAELVRLGGNERVVNIVAVMADQVRRARAMTLFVRPVPVKSNEDHRQVYEAILKGDAQTAGVVHRAHREYARQVLTELLEKLRVPRL